MRKISGITFHLYHYAGNNPVKYIDPDGNALHIVLGGGIGAGIGAIAELLNGGSAREVFAAAIGGAVTGAMAAATCGASLGVQIAGSAMAGTAGYLATEAVAGRNATVEGSVKSAAVGASGAMVGGIGSKISTTITSKINNVPKLKNGDIVYRVYGQDSHYDGASWTTSNPAKVSNYRDKAGLPSGKGSGVNNSGQFIITGEITNSNACVTRRKALPLDGNKGGLNEYIIPHGLDNGSITIKNVQGVNPEF